MYFCLKSTKEQHQLNNKLLDQTNRSLSGEMPILDSMDEYLDFILPTIKPWGEDLYEMHFYVGRTWLEIRDNEDFHEAVLHILKDEGEYMVSVDGNVYQGAWTIVDQTNKLILERPVGGAHQQELFELAFMNKDFFILKKHGDQRRKGFKKYFVLGAENLVKGLEWRDVMELMFHRYRSNSMVIYFAVFVVLIIIVLLALM